MRVQHESNNVFLAVVFPFLVFCLSFLSWSVTHVRPPTSNTITMVQLAPLALLAALAGAVAGMPAAAYSDAVMDLQKKGRVQLDAALAKSKTCTKERLDIRREWCVPPGGRHGDKNTD